ncbi:MAG TPA: hypothetical protein VLC28_10135 [Flavitalea sp.]|nr:hypothetical protein [Flavitalea sp.]
MKWYCILSAFLVYSFSTATAQIQFKAGVLRITIDQQGQITELSTDGATRQYLYLDTARPLLSMVKDSKRYAPTKAAYNKSKKILSLTYSEAGITADVKVEEKNGYLSLDVVKAEPADQIDAVVWGPIPLNINDTVAEVIGVVRNKDIAIGMTVLNVKTLGGSYRTAEGMAEGRGEAGSTTSWGSTIQAYSINRDKPRFVDAWNNTFKNMPVPPIPGETVKGSRIAIWGVEPSHAINRIESIILAEKLPHPTINGKWLRNSPVFGHSYLISSFNENQVDSMIAFTKRAGLISLYHEGPFKSWGHYELSPESFPGGNAAIKNAVQKASAAGIYFGVHTLTNFINTDDRYVSPVPDPRLAKTGSSILTEVISDTSTTVVVESPEYFSNETSNSLHTVMVGQELIRYQSVSKSAPYQLLNCQRGAFGTKSSSHNAGDSIGKLLDHPYMVFFPNFELQKEICNNLVKLFNETGINHWDFDGHEGGLATGQGDYGIEMFSKLVTDKIDHEYLVGTSNSKTFYWNTGSYYNWGEPWYGGFKESMEDYRISNQAFFDRNYMPRMLGWYLLSSYTSMADMEWMLARAAGYDAGFAMVARPEALRTNPIAGDLLDAIREWEDARNSSSFSADQKERMKDPKNEFHLVKNGGAGWTLSQVLFSPAFRYEKFIRQPGEPTYSKFTLEQPTAKQALKFRLRAIGEEGSIKNIRLIVDNSIELNMPNELNAGETLIVDGTRSAIILDKTGKRKSSVQFPKDLPSLELGTHSLTIDGKFEGSQPPVLETQFRFDGKPEQVNKKK